MYDYLIASRSPVRKWRRQTAFVGHHSDDLKDELEAAFALSFEEISKRGVQDALREGLASWPRLD